MKKNVIVGKNSFVDPSNVFEGEVVIGEDNYIGPNNIIKNTVIGNHNHIEFSYIEDSTIGNDNSIGPFSHIRNNSIIHNNTRIGNYVEIKNSELFDKVKCAHLTYLGDCKVDEETNIGCGVITANYNGKTKERTIIGKNCFIGCNSVLIAPITIGDNCFIAANSVVNKSLNNDSFAIERNSLTIKHNRESK